MKIASLIGAALAACVSFPAMSSDMSSIAQSTFKLYTKDRGYCSTTFVGNSDQGALFLTAAHCVDEKLMNIRRQTLSPDLSTVLSEQVVYVKPVRTFESKDVALLQALDKDVKFAESVPDIATADEANSMRVGEPVMAVGYPAAETLAISKGEFTGKRAPITELGFDAPVYQSTVGVAGGNSGGALYAQFDGQDGQPTWKLVGVTSAMRRDNSIMSYFQTAETVDEVLRGFVNTKPPVVQPVNPDRDSLRIDER